MATTSLRFDDRLEVASNFIPWKARITLLLKENVLWDFTNTVAIPPTDPAELVIHQQKGMKAMRIILDGVKDHLIPHLFEKMSTRKMFVALTNHFHGDNTNRKMVLRDKLKTIKITKSDTMTSYLTGSFRYMISLQ